MLPEIFDVEPNIISQKVITPKIINKSSDSGFDNTDRELKVNIPEINIKSSESEIENTDCKPNFKKIGKVKFLIFFIFVITVLLLHYYYFKISDIIMWKPTKT